MNGFVKYIIKTASVFARIMIIVLITGTIVYFSVLVYADYKADRLERQSTARSGQEVRENEAAIDAAEEQRAREEAERADAYTKCLNQAYHEYQTEYDEECSKFIMDGECVISEEKRYELEGIYAHEKEKCEEFMN